MANRKKLNPEESPRAAFGVRLRTLREGRGWTQEDLSDRMGYSATHISGVEIGRRTPTPKFTARADRALGTGESLARQGEAVLHPAILEGFPEFVVQEGRAVEIRLFELGAMPGLFQSPAYAAAIVRGARQRGAITEQQADERLALLAKRQRSLERTPPPQIYAVLDESCIRQLVGGPEVMAEALGRVVDIAGLPNTVIQVAPFSLGERRALNKAVTLATLPDRAQVSYAESAHAGQLQREPGFVGPLFTAYHQLQAEALSQADSVALIEQVRKDIS